MFNLLTPLERLGLQAGMVLILSGLIDALVGVGIMLLSPGTALLQGAIILVLGVALVSGGRLARQLLMIRARRRQQARQPLVPRFSTRMAAEMRPLPQPLDYGEVPVGAGTPVGLGRFQQGPVDTNLFS